METVGSLILPKSRPTTLSQWARASCEFRLSGFGLRSDVKKEGTEPTIKASEIKIVEGERKGRKEGGGGGEKRLGSKGTKREREKERKKERESTREMRGN